jgi:alpha-glucosidase
VLSNHDVARHVSRYARPQRDLHGYSLQSLLGLPRDLPLGRRRARAAALLMLALPGGAYVYQGDELGLEEVEDLPDELLQDPTWKRSGQKDRGRDGCRVPIPWAGAAPPFGFGPDGSTPWLPQPAHWRERTADAESRDRGSVLALYREALGLRRDHAALGDGTLTWVDAPAGVLHFRRDPGFACLVNLADDALAVPPGGRVLLSSGPLEGDLVPSDTAVWLGHDD